MLSMLLCSVADGGAVYDVLGYVHPFLTVAHDGMMFSTPYQDWDFVTSNTRILRRTPLPLHYSPGPDFQNFLRLAYEKLRK